MPLVFPVVLLLILGAVTLASRSTSTYLATTKQADSQAAREAAESGMNSVLIALDPFRKNATRPYMSYLLASTWDKTTGKWDLESVPSGFFQDCKISPIGLSGQTPGSASAVAAVRENTISTGLQYKIVNYIPPKRLDNPPWPLACNTITTAKGGTAQISVEGSVWRNNRKMASYTLTRYLDIEGIPFPYAPNIPNPGPPVSLRIEGTGVKQGSTEIKPFTYADFDTSQALETDPKQSLCKDCQAGLISPTPVATIPSSNSDLPSFPFDTDNPPITPQPILIDTTLPNSSACITPPVPPEPRERLDERDCWITDIGPGVIITVDTANPSDPQTPLKINMIILGNVGALGSPVSISHLGYDHTALSKRPNWSLLRIFGKKPQSPPSACSISQSLYIRANTLSGATAPSLHGAFVWLPQGHLYYGNLVNPSTTPQIHETAPAEILSSWWVCNLTLKLDGPMKFIEPLYGNPDALNGILPATPDPRFGPYPSLLRVKGIY